MRYRLRDELFPGCRIVAEGRHIILFRASTEVLAGSSTPPWTSNANSQPALLDLFLPSGEIGRIGRWLLFYWPHSLGSNGNSLNMTRRGQAPLLEKIPKITGFVSRRIRNTSHETAFHSPAGIKGLILNWIANTKIRPLTSSNQ